MAVQPGMAIPPSQQGHKNCPSFGLLPQRASSSSWQLTLGYHVGISSGRKEEGPMRLPHLSTPCKGAFWKSWPTNAIWTHWPELVTWPPQPWPLLPSRAPPSSEKGAK